MDKYNIEETTASRLAVGFFRYGLAIWIDTSLSQYFKYGAVFMLLISYLCSPRYHDRFRSVAKLDYLYIILTIPSIKYASVQLALLLNVTFLGLAPVAFCVIVSFQITGRFNIAGFLPERLSYATTGSLILLSNKFYLSEMSQILLGQGWLVFMFLLLLIVAFITLVALGDRKKMMQALFTIIINLYRLQGWAQTLWLQLLAAMEERHSSTGQPESTACHSRFVNYVLLEPGQIRLVVLEKRQLGKHARCRIANYSLSDLPRFTAISYVWGKPIFDCSLSVVGHSGQTSRLNITRSAFDILSREQSFFQEKYLWIDAICIDQTNKWEKAEQIPMMRQIYEKASAVNAYMDASVTCSDIEAWLDFFFWADWKNISTDSLYCIGRHEAFLEINKLYSSPWLRRMWILQEAVVSNNLTLIYRTTRIPWLVFNDLTRKVETGRLHNALSTSNQTFTADEITQWSVNMACVGELCRSRLMWLSNDELHLERLLCYGRRALSSDPRDKIFAVRGLVDVSVARSIPVSYSLSTRELYTQTMRALLKSTKNFNCIAYAGAGLSSPEYDLPSWVADWKSETAFPGYSYKPLYQASRCKSFKFSEEEQMSRLNIKAFRFDCVKVTGPVFDFDGYFQKNIANGDKGRGIVGETSFLLDLWMLVLQELGMKPEHVRAAREAFWLTLMTDRGMSGLRRLSRVGRADLAVQIHELGSQCANLEQDGLQKFEKMPFLTLFGGEWNEDLTNPVQLSRDVELSFIRQILLNLREKRFGVTEAGRLGLFPKDVQVGDQISLFNGAHVPFITRKAKLKSTDDENVDHVLLGSCYVHGVMDGTADKDTWEDIVLV